VKEKAVMKKLLLTLAITTLFNSSIAYFTNFEKPAAYVIGSLASLWMIQRIYSFCF